MAKQTIDFAKLIQEDREQRQQQQWQGTFLEYLELVKADPGLAKSAHRRHHDMIIEAGVSELNPENDPRVQRIYGDEPIKVYNFFKDEFFGMERTLDKIVRYFHSAAMGGEECRQVLYLMGPVGSGKSSLVDRLIRGLEELPPIYAIDGDPMLGDPLTLVPRHLRPAFEEMLGVKIEGDLNPVTRHRLLNEFGGRYEEMPVRTMSFSKRARRGIGVVPPVDPNNQDTSVLIGSEDISKLDRYSEGDPRILELNGAFNVGNRGMVEFIEVFKNETEYLHTMITATQERFVPAPGRHGTVYVDTCIVAHSNEAEWQKFKADHTNEAILDRIVVVRVPYNLRLTEEVKIYEKFLRRSKFDARIAPYTLEIASMFAILTRLEPTAKCDLMTKLRLYNGEEVIEKGRTKKLSARELHDDIKREGMFGISTRFIMKALDNALSQNPTSIHPISVREALIAMVREADLAEDVQEAVPRVPPGHLAQGVSGDAREGHHQSVHLLLQGAGRDAVPELPRPRRGVRHQVQGARSEHPRGAAARRGVPEVDRGADRDHRLGRGRLPPGGDRLSVGGDAPRRAHQLHRVRAAQGGDRAQADELGARAVADHHQGAHAGRGAAAEIRRHGPEPDRERLS